MIGFLLFFVFLVLVLFGIPIGISLGLSTVIAILVMPGLSLDFFVRGLVSGLDSFPLIAVLFFTIAGNIMGKGGISARLLQLADIFFGNIRGSLGIITVVACMMFAAISGTGSATVAAIGSIMIPAMIKKGYDKNFAGSLVASAGTIGAIIPPSVSMIVYAVSSGASVTSMFLAGVGPGILIGIFLIVYCYFYSRKHHYQNTSTVSHKDSTYYQNVIQKKEPILHSLWAISVPVMILGGIYSGVFTPTEAAGVAVVYGTIISIFIYKEIKWADLPTILLESTLLVSCVLVILGASIGFGRVLTLERVPISIANFITSITENKILILFLINILLLVVGTFMETLAAIVILTPILLPIAQKIGVDPTHFGIIMIVNLCIGFITPPLGANLFMTAQVGKLQFDELARSILIWVFIMVLALMFITYIPSISLGLEHLLQ